MLRDIADHRQEAQELEALREGNKDKGRKQGSECLISLCSYLDFALSLFRHAFPAVMLFSLVFVMFASMLFFLFFLFSFRFWRSVGFSEVPGSLAMFFFSCVRRAGRGVGYPGWPSSSSHARTHACTHAPV